MRHLPEDEIERVGKIALARIKRKGGNTKSLRSDLMWREVERLLMERWQQADVAKALNVSERRIRQLKAQYATETIFIPNVKTLEKVRPEFAPFTAEAFAGFFEFYNEDEYKVPPHVKGWLQAFIDNRNLLLNVPPRHAKSHYFSLWIPLWLICRDRNVQIILVSETKEFAKGWASEIAGQLESNIGILEDLGRFAPERKGDFAWRPENGAFAVRGRTRHARGAQLTIQSRGMEQQILGMEADYVILDDPTNAEKAASETEHKAEMDHLRHQVFTRIEGLTKEGSGGRAVVIGQRVHPKDMYGELASQVYERGPQRGLPFWHHEMHPAVRKWPEDNGGKAEVLWPTGKPFEELMISYERVGGYEPFECIFQQNPAPSGTRLFKPEWFAQCKDRSRGGYEGVRDSGVVGVSRVLSIDPSPDNFHGIVVGDLLYSRDQFYLILMEMKHFRSGLRDLMKEVRRCVEVYDFDYLIFEQSTFSKWFYEDPTYMELRDKFRTITHKTNINKHSLEYGQQSLATDFEFNRISLPYGDDAGRAMTDLLSTEVLPYPDADYDDILDALWFIKANYKKLRPLDKVIPLHQPKDKGWSWMEQMKRDQSARNYERATRVG